MTNWRENKGDTNGFRLYLYFTNKRRGFKVANLQKKKMAAFSSTINVIVQVAKILFFLSRL